MKKTVSWKHFSFSNRLSTPFVEEYLGGVPTSTCRFFSLSVCLAVPSFSERWNVPHLLRSGRFIYFLVVQKSKIICCGKAEYFKNQYTENGMPKIWEPWSMAHVGPSVNLALAPGHNNLRANWFLQGPFSRSPIYIWGAIEFGHLW